MDCIVRGVTMSQTQLSNFHFQVIVQNLPLTVLCQIKMSGDQACSDPADLTGKSHPMDDTVHEILQARILEWVAFPFSRGSSQPRD